MKSNKTYFETEPIKKSEKPENEASLTSDCQKKMAFPKWYTLSTPQMYIFSLVAGKMKTAFNYKMPIVSQNGRRLFGKLQSS